VNGTPPAGLETSQNRRVSRNATALAALDRQVADLRERLTEMKALDDARQERDAWQRQAETLSNRPLLLPAPATRVGWWPFRGTG
jgi:hypothetical protein